MSEIVSTPPREINPYRSHFACRAPSTMRPTPRFTRQPHGYIPCPAFRSVSRARPAIRRSPRRREPPHSATPASSAVLRNRRGWLLRFLLRAQPHHLHRNGGSPAARPRRSRRRQPPDFSIDLDIPRSGAERKVAVAIWGHTGAAYEKPCRSGVLVSWGRPQKSSRQVQIGLAIRASLLYMETNSASHAYLGPRVHDAN